MGYSPSVKVLGPMLLGTVAACSTSGVPTKPSCPGTATESLVNGSTEESYLGLSLGEIRAVVKIVDSMQQGGAVCSGAFVASAWVITARHCVQIASPAVVVAGLRPSSLYALRRSGEDADVKWDQGIILVRRSRGIKGRVMEMTKTNHDQVIKVPDFVMSVLRWHVDKQLITRDMERSELLFPSELGGFRHNSALAKPFRAFAKAMGITKRVSPKAMRRSFQDAMREAQVANVVVRSISGQLTGQMQQPYATARGHEQEQAIARIVDLTRVQLHEARGNGLPMDSKVGSIGGQHKGTA
jgi:hypothetical protein